MSMLTQSYQAARLLTSSPGQVVVSLYDGALRFVRDAARHFEARDAVSGRGAVSRAEMILLELMAALDLDRGGELARSLMQIYRYVFERMAAARASERSVELREIEGILADLRDAWALAEQQLRQER